jgi:hypothetical protein
METNNKYYTPAIEDFYVGFEYEFNYTTIPDYKQRGRTWEKVILNDSVLDIGQDSETEDENPFYNSLNRFRVKYLDSEDIESLGFKHQKEELYYNEDRMLSLEFKDGIATIARVKKSSLSYLLFTGILKNKSELVKLLQQIDLLNNV